MAVGSITDCRLQTAGTYLFYQRFKTYVTGIRFRKELTTIMAGHRDLKAYQIAYRLAMAIFHASKSFPKEERYALIDQIRRSSRSVVANSAEGYRKRQYPKMFLSKLADADGEATETQVWLDFAHDCGAMRKLNACLAA